MNASCYQLEGCTYKIVNVTFVTISVYFLFLQSMLTFLASTAQGLIFQTVSEHWQCVLSLGYNASRSQTEQQTEFRPPTLC